MTTTITKMEWVKDENGSQVYNGLDKFRQKMIKQAERHNKKVAAAHLEGRLMSYSILNPVDYAETMVNIYGHSFRAMKPAK